MSAWPVCGKSDKEAAPRVQRAITQLPRGVQGCILGVCITQLTHPSKTYTTHTHSHTFTSDKNCPSFEALRWLFQWSLILDWFPTCSLTSRFMSNGESNSLLTVPEPARQHGAPNTGSKMVWNLSVMAPCGTFPAPWTAKAASKSTLPCTDLHLGESFWEPGRHSWLDQCLWSFHS